MNFSGHLHNCWLSTVRCLLPCHYITVFLYKPHNLPLRPTTATSLSVMLSSCVHSSNSGVPISLRVVIVDRERTAQKLCF